MNIKIQLSRPHENQVKFIESTAQHKTLMAGRRFGKSWVSKWVSIQHMLKGEHVAFITPTMELGRTFYNDIKKTLPPEVIARDNQTDRVIELITGGTLKFMSAEVLDRFRGLSFDMVICDEASLISNLSEFWNEAVMPTLMDRNGKSIWISTPRGKEAFFARFLKGKNGEPGYQSFHFTSYQNPMLQPGVIDAMKKEMTEAQFNQEVLAIAGENASNPFGTDTIKRNTLTQLSKEPTVVYGIDLAKYNDYTVICGLSASGQQTYFDRFQLPWELTKKKIEALPGNILKTVDSTGVGDVIYEGLQQTCQNIRGFKFTTESKPKIIYELIKDVEQGNVKFIEAVADEMMVYEYKYTSTGHITFNAMSGYHDDAVCALAIANHHKNQAIQTNNWKLWCA